MDSRDMDSIDSRDMDSIDSRDEKGRRNIKTAEIDSAVERCRRDRRRMNIAV